MDIINYNEYYFYIFYFSYEILIKFYMSCPKNDRVHFSKNFQFTAKS